MWLSLKVGRGLGDWDVGIGDVRTRDVGHEHMRGLEEVGRRD